MRTPPKLAETLESLVESTRKALREHTLRESRPALHSGYVPVNGLRMYYEVQGNGKPLVLLHGGSATIEYSFAKLRPAFARRFRTVAVEQQAHGHTPDLDRPLMFEQMADDTAAVLKQLNVEHADVFGWSDGGNVALGLAIRHPELVRKVALIGTNYNNDGLRPEILQGIKDSAARGKGAAEAPMPPGLRESYVEASHDPKGWANLFSKVQKQGATFRGWQLEALRAIQAPVLVMVGDSDIVRPQHAVELFELVQHGQLAVLPGADHFALRSHAELLDVLLTEFFASPLPAAND